jgi:hypothetical protein
MFKAIALCMRTVHMYEKIAADNKILASVDGRMLAGITSSKPRSQQQQRPSSSSKITNHAIWD